MNFAYENLTEQTIAAALSFVDQDCDRETWCRMAMAIKAELGDSGLHVWDNWSKSGTSYDANDARDTWKSIKAHGGVNIGTLIYAAKEAGFTFDFNQHHQISEEEARARQAKREKEAQQEREKEAKRHARAAEDAAAILAKSDRPTARHPYLRRKGLEPSTGMRVGVWHRWHGDGYIDIPGTLIIPISNANGKLTSLQGYFPDASNPLGRDRDYLPGGQKQQSFFRIGDPKTAADGRIVIILCEGWATGQTVHMATGHCVLVAFDRSNMEPVARIARDRWPESAIILAADNDRWGKDPAKNPGIGNATAAANAVHGNVCVPQFEDVTGKPTDFDDLRRQEGIEAVTRQFSAVMPAAPAANDNVPAPRGPLEAALADFVVFYGCDLTGTVYMWDVRTKAMRQEKLARLCNKAALLSIAPIMAWEVAVAIEDPNGKFTVDRAFSVLVGIVKSKPEYQPPKNDKPAKGLTGQHGADSHIISERIRKTTLFDEFSLTWYSWDTIWRPIPEGNVSRMVINALDEAFSLEYDQSSFTGTFNLLKKRLGRAPTMNADNTAALDAWNQDRNFLPMRNGVLHLATSQLLPHSPELMMPWLIPHDYSPDADCPTIVDFMHQLAQGYPATEAVLYAGLAAILRGRADLQKYMELVGVAGTGKSTYIKICQQLVGDENVAVTTMTQLNGNQFETANLYGKRLVIISDADKYGGSVDVFKAITGQDPVRREEKHKQVMKPFIYGGMVIVAANQPVQFSDTSTAMVRRRVPIHIDRKLDQSKVDPALGAKLSVEIPGLINLLIGMSDDDVTNILCDKGNWRRDAAMRAMCETNPIAAWLNDMVIASPGGNTKIGTKEASAFDHLYPSYVKYSDVTGRKGVIGLPSFSRAVLEVLAHAGIDAEKRKDRYGAHITGIALRGRNDTDVKPLLYGERPEVDMPHERIM